MAASRREFLLACASAGAFSCLPFGRHALGAGAEIPINTDWDNVAIQGYDTVAYFADGRPVKGMPEFETVWSGARWRFASAAHRDLFTSQPESYAPRFGGFCAGALIHGETVKADPEVWAIVDGKLYLNADKEGLVDWQQDAPGNIAKGEENWSALGH